VSFLRPVNLPSPRHYVWPHQRPQPSRASTPPPAAPARPPEEEEKNLLSAIEILEARLRRKLQQARPRGRERCKKQLDAARSALARVRAARATIPHSTAPDPTGSAAPD